MPINRLLIILVGCICVSQVLAQKSDALNLSETNNSLFGKCIDSPSVIKHNCFGILRHSIDGMVYTGEFQNGKANGQGILVFKDGRKFQGNFRNGVIDGYGEAIFPNGDKYIGNFNQMSISGEGYLQYFDKRYYRGELLNGVRNGEGIFYSSAESKYIGNYKNGKRDGKGLFLLNEKEFYSGDFYNDLPHGNGIYKYPDGTVYIGEFINGLPNGFGKFITNDGNTFIGAFDKGKLNGKIRIQDRDGTEMTVDYLNGQIIPYEKCNDLTESSKWINCIGTIEISAGYKYTGIVNYGVPDGKGIVFDSSGNSFKIGLWRKGNFLKSVPVENNFLLTK